MMFRNVPAFALICVLASAVGCNQEPSTGLVSVQTVDRTSAAGPLAGIVNGGFETCDFAGWTTSGAHEFAAFDPGAAHSGNCSAVGGELGGTVGCSNISQTFTVPVGKSHLSFWYEIICYGTIATDWATATLEDDTTKQRHTILGKMCPKVSNYTEVTLPVTAGHQYTLTLTNEDSGNSTVTFFDDVRLD